MVPPLVDFKENIITRSNANYLIRCVDENSMIIQGQSGTANQLTDELCKKPYLRWEIRKANGWELYEKIVYRINEAYHKWLKDGKQEVKIETYDIKVDFEKGKLNYRGT